MDNNTFKEKIGEFFGLHDSDRYIELETWTNGGVNTFINLDEEEDVSLFEQFKERVLNFDVDHEIDINRQDPTYRDLFTISESLKDFEDFQEWLNSVLEKLSE